MKSFKLLAGCALACAAVALSGCNSLGGVSIPSAANSATSANSALHDFLTDPNCAHHDEANFVTGAAGVPASFQARVLRDCPARNVSVGAVVGAAATAAPAAATP